MPEVQSRMSLDLHVNITYHILYIFILYMNNILYDYDMLSWYVSLSIPGKGLLLRHRAISVHSRQLEADEGRWYCTAMLCCHGGTQWSQNSKGLWIFKLQRSNGLEECDVQCCKTLKRRKPVSHSFQSALSTSPVRLQRPWRLLVRKGGAMQLWAVCSMRNGPTCAALLCSSFPTQARCEMRCH